MTLSDSDKDILSPQALDFIAKLHKQFDARRQSLLAKRTQRQLALDSGDDFPDFRLDTREIRDSDWTVGPIPHDLRDRRVEITGPVDRKMVINALNSGAKVFMADFEDSSTPTWRNLMEGQVNLYDAIRRNIHYQDPETKKHYSLNNDPAVLMVRPRGWHLPESHVLVNGSPISGSLFDFGLYVYHNAKELLKNGTGPYFYLPKLQSAEEAKLWNDVFQFASNELGIPGDAIKCTVLIEHLLASFEMNEILWNLKDHIVGLNCGRWDYIFSYIKTFRNYHNYIMPDRFQVGMTSPFMRAYSLLTIQTCHRRGALAMGGMAAQIPIKNDVAANEIAMSLVRQDKEREATDGHDGTWVAHPGLVPIATKIFDGLMAGRNQLEKRIPEFLQDSKSLTTLPKGTRTLQGLRHNVNVNLGYMEAWLRGKGCVPLYNMMEDAATAEISRAQLWQWTHHGATLEDGSVVSEEMVRRVVEEEAEGLLRGRSGEERVGDAARLFLHLNQQPSLPEFLTTPAYEQLVQEGQ